MLTVYKVIRLTPAARDMTSCVAWGLPGFRRTYKIGRTEESETPLFIFADLFSAKRYIEGFTYRPQPYRILRCETPEVFIPPNVAPYLPSRSERRAPEEYWAEAGFQKLRGRVVVDLRRYDGMECPTGTMMVFSLTPKEILYS